MIALDWRGTHHGRGMIIHTTLAGFVRCGVIGSSEIYAIHDVPIAALRLPRGPHLGIGELPAIPQIHLTRVGVWREMEGAISD